jgi:6-methylsalicylate decarboxylase
MRIDMHQHLWSEPFVDALAARDELPFVRREHGLTVLFIAGERPYVIDVGGESGVRRAELIARDGLDHALICMSSPLGVERLAREEAVPLLDAYHQGALALGEPFGVWGSLALDRHDPGDVDHALARGCVGISLPAGALAGLDALASLRPLLRRLEDAGAPLLVHPGPGPGALPAPAGAGAEPSLADPLWWSALTRYVSQMHAAWLTFVSAGRAEHPRLRAIFAMLAGLAPLHGERLSSRGGPATLRRDPLTFYETSSYGRDSVQRVGEVVGAEQILYGSDRPVVDPAEHGVADALDWGAVADATRRALGDRAQLGGTHGGAGARGRGARDTAAQRRVQALAR